MPSSLRLELGPWTALFEEGALRRLSWKGHEALRGIYGAVRDQNWGTVKGELEVHPISSDGSRLELTFTSRHRQGAIAYSWTGRIVLTQTEATYEFDGLAESSFLKNRIGLCVLHPREAAGRAAEALDADGSLLVGCLPESISPHQPYFRLSRLTHEAAPGLKIATSFEGDVFEMEDQRNWTDASLKTYSTPLSEPFPVRVERGDRVRQRIVVRAIGNAPEIRQEGPILITLGEPRGPRPLVGSELTPGCPPPIPLDFLRTSPDHFAEARSYGLPLELVLTLREGTEQDQLRRLQVLPGDRLLLFHEGHKTSPEEWLKEARRLHPEACLIGGTDHFFAELNRERVDPALVDGLTLSINPQVHAFDDMSLMETLGAQADCLASASSFAKGKPVGVSPITLRMRQNPNATDGSRLSLEDRMDPRLSTQFGKAWTAGSLKELGEAGASSLAYFETGGPLGIAETPLAEVLEFFVQSGRSRVIAASSSSPLAAGALVLESDSGRRACLFNLTPEAVTVVFESQTRELAPYETLFL